MKRYILLFFVFYGSLKLEAQSFSAFEYFFSTDPGFGLATAISGVPTGNSINFTANILPPSNIQPGFHYLSFRGRSTIGTTTFPALSNRWSVTYSIPMIIFPASTGTINSLGINKMEYFFGIDPGFGNGTGINISPDVNGSVIAPITIPAGQTPGFYMMAYRVRTNSGQWSVTKALPFIVWSNTVNPNRSPIAKLEYYLDYDPGNGLAINIPFTPNPSVDIQTAINLDLTGLPLGEHIIYVRALDNQGVWSSPKPATINISCDNGVKLFTTQTGNWNDVSTWACGRVPTSTDNVYIKALHKVTLNIGQSGACKTIDNDRGAILDIAKGAIMSIKETIF